MSSTPWCSSFIHTLRFSLHLSSIQWAFNHFAKIGTALTKGKKARTFWPITSSQNLLYNMVFKLLFCKVENASKFKSTQTEVEFETGPPYWTNAFRSKRRCQHHAQRMSFMLYPEDEAFISKSEILTHLKCKTSWACRGPRLKAHIDVLKIRSLSYIWCSF